MIKIATQVFETKVFELQDGGEITVKPLTIRRLRKFMEVIGQLNETDEEGKPKVSDENTMVDVLFDAAIVAIEKGNKEYASDRERLEDALDMPTLHQILEVAGGVKLNDPNLAAAGLGGQT